MIPVLYPVGTTNFQKMGLGKLGEIMRCEVTEELNGIWELTFDYPVNGFLYNDLFNGSENL